MTIPYEIAVPGIANVAIYADGEVEIGDDYAEYASTNTFTLAEMEQIVLYAKAHFHAYDAWKNRGYEGEDLYHELFKDLTQRDNK